MSNNGTGFWVMIALIAALSCVAILEAAIATFRILARYLVQALLHALAKRPSQGRERKDEAAMHA
jgi:hypothetical protein